MALLIGILLFILRSRNFSSNSQQVSMIFVIFLYCCLYCEAETFQAIHNWRSDRSQEEPTVVYTAKQKLFKQFTTW